MSVEENNNSNSDEKSNKRVATRSQNNEERVNFSEENITSNCGEVCNKCKKNSITSKLCRSHHHEKRMEFGKGLDGGDDGTTTVATLEGLENGTIVPSSEAEVCTTEMI